jgi:predicted RNA-binding protein with PUA-like domain
MGAMAKPAQAGGLWLLKTEPGEFSFDDLERAPSTVWDGVTNFTALRHMRDVRKGDRALIYHTGAERAAVGTATVLSDAYPDPRGDDPRIVVFDLRAGERLARPVTLAAIKADPAFAGWDLVRLPRLSVMPVPPALWRRILALGGA